MAEKLALNATQQKLIVAGIMFALTVAAFGFVAWQSLADDVREAMKVDA